MVIIMYLFPVYLHAGLIGPTKSSPHFINGYLEDSWPALYDFELPILLFIGMHHKICSIH
jgi:hypothetical protein